MKKKLLLSSVAALTLFAAYNTAFAEHDASGVVIEKPEEKESYSSIKSIEKAEDLADALVKYQARFALVKEARKVNHELKVAKELEAEADSEYKKAEKAYDEAVKKVNDAINTKYNAEVERTNLLEIQGTYTSRLNVIDQQIADAQTAYDTALADYNAKSTALETADRNLDTYLNEEKPSKGADQATVNAFTLRVANLERVADLAEEKLVLAEKVYKEAEKQLKELKDNKVLFTKRHAVLEERIGKLTHVITTRAQNAAAETTDGEVGGVLISTLEEERKQAYENLWYAGNQRIYATKERKEKEAELASKLKLVEKQYKADGVEYSVEEVLAAAEKTDTFVTKFGWNKDEAGNWNYLLNSEGKKAMNQWVNDNGSWYYLGQDGVMKKWWVQVEGTWYYLNGSGAMQTGWLQDNGTWYYLEASGAMKANQWFEVGGKWYHVDASGALSVNTTVDGYNVNENGEWV